MLTPSVLGVEPARAAAPQPNAAAEHAQPPDVPHEGQCQCMGGCSVVIWQGLAMGHLKEGVDLLI